LQGSRLKIKAMGVMAAAVKTTSCSFPHCHLQAFCFYAAAVPVEAILVIMTGQRPTILARKRAKDQGNGGDSTVKAPTHKMTHA